MAETEPQARRRVSDLVLLAFVVLTFVLLGIELGRNVVASLARPADPVPAASEE